MRFSYAINVIYFFFQVLSTSCIKGVSADEGPEVKPNKVDLDGMDFLSEWSLWSRCSRTCGTGVQFRGRRCNRDRSPCLRFPRQHRTCNNQLCPVNSLDFRDVQCAREDDRGVLFKGKKAKWNSIQRGTTKCMLFCHPIGQRVSFYLGRVVDGTKCIDEPYSVCVAGKCTSVGCDRVIGSQKVFDRCKVCGGNGSTCEPYSGMIDREPTAEEKNEGYLNLFVIPKDATTILISEVSQNYLAIKRASGEFVFGGDKKMADPGTYRINTTDFQYSKLPSENSEAVMIMGPTMEEFYVMAILTYKDNPKADFEYWLPKNIPTTPPKPVFKTHTRTTNPKTRVTSKATSRKTIFVDRNFLEGRKTKLVFPSSEHPSPHTQPMTQGDLPESSPSTPEQHMSTEYSGTTASTPSSHPTTQGDLAQSSPSTPEQHMSTEYSGTTASTPSSHPMTQGDLAKSSPSTPEQHMSTEYSGTTASTPSSHPTTQGDLAKSSPSTPEQDMSTEYSGTTASTPSSHPITQGDLAQSSPSTPEQHMSTEYSGTTASTPSSHPMTQGDLAHSSPSTPEQHMSTEYSGTTASTPSSHPMTQGDLAQSSPSTPEQHMSTEYSGATASTPSSHPMTTEGDLAKSSPSTPEQDMSTEYSGATASMPSSHPMTAAGGSGETSPSTLEEHISAEYSTTNTGVDLKGDHQDSLTQTSTSPSGQPITTTLNNRTTTTEQPRMTQEGGTTNTTEHPTTTQDAAAANLTTNNEKPTEMLEYFNSPKQNRSVTDSSSSNLTSSEAPVATRPPSTIHLPVLDNSSSSRFLSSPGTRSTMESPTATHIPSTSKTPTTQNLTTTPPSRLATQNAFITEGMIGTEGESELTREPHITETMLNTSELNVNDTSMNTWTDDGNSTKHRVNTTKAPLGQSTSNVQPTLLESTTPYEGNSTNTEQVTKSVSSEDSNKTGDSTPRASVNSSKISGKVKGQLRKVENRTVMSDNTIEYSTEQPVATEPTTATQNQNVTIVNKNETVQLTATESQNVTTQPTPTTESQNVTTQPTPTAENQNITTQPTPTAENQNTTTQPTPTAENQNTTTHPTPTTENHNVTTQPTPTAENQNTTTQPTPTAENHNVTTQPTPTAENQNTTTQPTPTAENQNITTQPTPTAENQNTTTQPTPTAENQNTTTHPTPTTENHNVTTQPTPTAENQNTTTQPTPTAENHNVTTQPIELEKQNASVQPITSGTVQPTATENRNVTEQPSIMHSISITEKQNASVQPTTSGTVQPIAAENRNVTEQPSIMHSISITEKQNASVQPITSGTLQPTATENRNVTEQPSIMHSISITEKQNASVQPTTSGTVQPIAAENRNVTEQPSIMHSISITEKQNAFVQPTTSGTLQPIAAENRNVTEQPSIMHSISITEKQNASVQPTTSGTVQPIAAENRNVTEQPSIMHSISITEKQNAFVQPTTSGTVQPIAAENRNVTEQPSIMHSISITEKQNASVQPTTSGTVQPIAAENRNFTEQPSIMHSISITEKQNASVQPTTFGTVQPIAAENRNVTEQPSIMHSISITEKQNASVQPTTSGTVQPTATENRNVTEQPSIMHSISITEKQNASVQPTTSGTVQPTATENRNVTEQPSIMHSISITEKQNASVQPTTSGTVQPTATENRNVTEQPSIMHSISITEKQNASVQPTTSGTVQPTATENRNVTEQPSIMHSISITEKQNASVQPTTSGTVQPTATENRNVTEQPSIMHSISITEKQNASVQPTTSGTVQPTATENRNVTEQPSIMHSISITEKQNASVQPTTSGTVQPTATENRNVTEQPSIMHSISITEKQNASVQPTTSGTVQPTATENRNVTEQPSIMHSISITEKQNASVQPTTSGTVQPTATENRNVTEQPSIMHSISITEKQNASVQPTTSGTVQPTATENRNVTEQPSIMHSISIAEKQNASVQPTTSGTVRPTATENRNVTEQPSIMHSISIAEKQNASVQPTTSGTVQPIAAENRNVTSQNGTLQPITTEAVQSTAKDNVNATTQPTATGTVPPAATEDQNTSTHPVMTAHINTTRVTTTKSPNITFDKFSGENSTTTYDNFTEKSNPALEQNNTTVTARKPTDARLADAKNTERPTMTTEQTADKQFIDTANYSSTGQPMIKEGLPTDHQNMTSNHGTVLPTTARETNSTRSPILKRKDKMENQKSEFMPWSPWTLCSRTCGLGFKVRARLCKQSNESICPRNETQVVLCTIRQCEKLVPTWSPWRPWTACSSQCGVGLRIRVRSCLHSKVITLVRSSCPGPRYQMGICRSFANCSTRVEVVKPSAVSLIDTLEMKTISKVTLPVTTKINASTMGGFSSETRRGGVTRVVASSSSIEGFIRMTPSVSSETSFTESLAALVTSSAAAAAAATSQSSPSSRFAKPTSAARLLVQPSPSSFSSSSSILPSSSSSSVAAAAAEVAISRKLSPSASRLAKPTSAARLLVQPSPSSFSSSSSMLPSSSSSILLQPVPCVSCANAPSKASSAHPLPTRMTSLGPSLSTTVMQTPKLSTSSSPLMADTAIMSSLPKTSTSRSLEGSFEVGTMSKVHASDVASIEPSRTSIPIQQSSAGIVQVQSGSCSRCRTSRKKQKLFCTGDYAIRVQVKNDTLTSNKKTVYHLLVQNIYKSTLPLTKELFIRVTGIQCPCPKLKTGKEYLIIGRARRTKKGNSKVLINRRSYVEEWSGRVHADVKVLRNKCLTLGFNISSSYRKPVDLKSGNGGENNSSASVIPATGKPTTTRSTRTTVNKYSDCPACVLSANSSIGSLYCTSEYAIRARVTKYRKATNRTMFYAHLITTYKTTNELPFEVLIRVPGEKCPCPRLVPGTEYLMIGKTKNTLTGKSRLTLNVESFYAEWRDEFVKEIDTTKARCGLSVATPPLHGILTMVMPDQSTPTLTPTVNPTAPATRPNNTSCPQCDQPTVLDNQQKRFCKNKNVFRGLVAKSFSTATNRTIYYITMVTSFKTNFEMPNKILARLSDNSCHCSRLTVGKEYLIMGQVKMNKKGKARVVLTKKSFIQDWNSELIGKTGQLRMKCELPVVKNGSGPSIEPSGTPQEITTTASKAVQPTTATEVTKTGMCQPCRVSANVHDFCSNDYVFRGRVLKSYRTSANRTAYHVSVTTSYKSSANLSSVVLVRVLGVSCPCPQLQVGVDYIIMGWVRVKGKSTARMTLLPKNFVQKWDEGFEEELSSIRSSCKKPSIIDGPLVQPVAVEKATSVIPKPSTTSTTTTSTMRTTTQASKPTPSVNLIRTTETRCAPCQTSKKRNRLYCTSDYVLAVEIEKKEHNPVTQNTKYYAVVKYTFKQRDPLAVMVVLWVLHNQCNCPDLQLNHTYVVMVNSNFGENGVERLVMSERSFIKGWTTGLQRRILKLKNICYTDHRRRY